MNQNLTVRKLTADEMEKIYIKHLVKDFPAGEVKPLATILEGQKSGKYLGYGMFLKDEGEELAGYAFFMNIRPEPIYLLDYFAVVEDKRSGGYGSAFLSRLNEICSRKHRRLILEVENPDYEENDSLRKKMQRRIAFYKKNEIHVSGVTCNFYHNEYRILYAGTPMEDQEVYQKLHLSYVDFFGEEFVERHVRYHAVGH